MNKKSKIIIIILSVLLLGVLIGASIGLYSLYNQNQSNKLEIENLKNEIKLKDEEKKEILKNKHEWLGILKIPKIGLKQEFIDANGDTNCVDESICDFSNNKNNDTNNKIFVLGAHSDVSETGYFKNVNKLKKGDKAYIYDNDKKYECELVSISYQNKKTNSIKIDPKSFLTIFTVDKKDPNKKYLVLNFKLVKTTDDPDLTKEDIEYDVDYDTDNSTETEHAIVDTDAE